MTSRDIRLLIPGGEPYAGALIEGVSKVAQRRGMSDEAVADVEGVVELAAAAINSSAPRSIELIIGSNDGYIAVALRAEKPTVAADPTLFAAFGASAQSRTTSCQADAVTGRISFDVATQ